MLHAALDHAVCALSRQFSRELPLRQPPLPAGLRLAGCSALLSLSCNIQLERCQYHAPLPLVGYWHFCCATQLSVWPFCNLLPPPPPQTKVCTQVLWGDLLRRVAHRTLKLVHCVSALCFCLLQHIFPQRKCVDQLTSGNRGQVKQRVQARTHAREAPPPPPTESALPLLLLRQPLFFYLFSSHIGIRQGLTTTGRGNPDIFPSSFFIPSEHRRLF
jgi:hypothetical protein